MDTKHLIVPLRSAIELNLNCDYELSDELLTCFLQARKCDLQRAFKLFLNYTRMAKNHPDLLRNLDYELLKNHLNLQTISGSDDQHGRRIFIFRAGQWNPNHYSVDDIFRCNVYCLQKLASESQTQSKGLVILVDLDGFSLQKAKHFSAGDAQRIASLVKDCFPLRFQAIHIVNEPWFVNVILAIFWPFLSEKLQKRIHKHGKCWTSLHKHIDMDCLPEDYGGSQSSVQHCNWPQHLTHNDNLFNSI